MGNYFQPLLAIPILNMETMRQRFFRHFLKGEIHYAGTLLAFLTLMAATGGVFMVMLFAHLHPDIEELLPKNVRGVRDFDTAAERLRSLESLVVLVQSSDPSQAQKFVETLVPRLQSLPQSVVSLVTWRLGPEFSFFRRNAPLFLSLNDINQIDSFLHRRITYEQQLALRILPEEDLGPKPEFQFTDLEKKYRDRFDTYDRMPGGYFATPDRKNWLVVIYMPGKGLSQALRLKSAVDEVVQQTYARLNIPSLSVHYTGNVENLIEESQALVEDLITSSVVVLLFETAVLLLFFQSVLATLSLLYVLGLGVLLCFGIAYPFISYLNANSAFLASIIIGNGINFGVILLARYLEERRRNHDHRKALRIALSSTQGATLTAALASGLSYGSLMLTSFRGFNQFGFIGLLGMTLCWLTTYAGLPAALTLCERYGSKNWFTRERWKLPQPMGRLSQLLQKKPILFACLSLLLTFTAAVSFFRLPMELLETDLSKLKDKRSQKYGSGALYHYIDDVFGHSLSPMVALAPTSHQAVEIAEELRKLKTTHPQGRLLTTIQTLEDFVPADQEKKIPVLRDIAHLLKKFPPHGNLSQNEWVQTFMRMDPKALKPFGVDALPTLLLDRFREKSGTVGHVVIVDKKVDTSGRDDAAELVGFVAMVRHAVDKIAPGTPVAGQLPIIADMISSIQKDGPLATAAAAGCVVVLVILLFRKANTILWALTALGLGVFWLFGIILGARYKINFLNFIALPITFGIGVDYGVNIFQRCREESRLDVFAAVRTTGGAVLLCSITTIIGYGSLLIAGNQAFVSFGTLAIWGEITCVGAALIALPTLMELFSRLKKHHA